MLQEIIVYLIIAVVFALLVRGAVRMFKKNDASSPCAGCSGCDIKPEKGDDKDNPPTSCGR